MSSESENAANSERVIELGLASIKTTAQLEDAGVSTIWERIAKGEYDVVRDGGRTKITLESIKRRQANLPRVNPADPNPRTMKATLAARRARAAEKAEAAGKRGRKSRSGRI